MSYIGDFAEDYATLNMKFTTVKDTGLPTVLAGTPVISVYKANGLTQSTAGITLTVDFDSVVGLNNVLIDLSADAFYAVANDYHIVITTGTVNSVSVIGYVVGEFSIQNRFMRGTDNAVLASLFTGITSLAEWLGLIAGKQVANATALTEVKATGAGSGTYDESTDSQEAISITAGAIPTTAMRGTDGVDTATMRGTDSASTHSAADIWTVGTRTLTSFGTLIVDIWKELTSAIVTAGSIGKLLVDNVDAKISLQALNSTVAKEATATTNKNTIVTDLDDVKGTGFVKDTDSNVNLSHQAGTKGTDNIFDDTDGGGAGPWTTGSGGTNPTILQNTTIATLATQKSFTLTAGSADNDAYNGSMIVIQDASTSTQKARALVLSYVGSTKTITLVEDPGVFTMAVGDTVDIVAIMTKKEMAQAQRDQAIFDTNINKSSNMGVLRPLIGLGAFNERTGVTSEDITKSLESRAIFFSTLTDTVTDPEETFGGALLRFKDQDENPFVAKGGYFFTDSGNTVSQIWGIAADMGFTNGGSQTNPASTAGWSGTDTLEDGSGNGWTFLGEAMGEDFNHSGKPIEIRKIGSGASAGSASVTTTADAIILQNTTIATLASQTSFTLTAGSADNDAYNGAVMVIKDSATAEQKAVGVVSDYVGSTKTITLLNNPGIFTMAVGDTIDILADRSLKPATDNATLKVSSSGLADADLQAINAITGSADKFEQGAAAIVTGTAIAGTLTTTQMTTDLSETTNNHFVGLVVKWTEGGLLGQGTEITAYDGATKTLTYTTITNAPAATDKFVIN